MDYGITINDQGRGAQRYRNAEGDRWELEHACILAASFIHDRDRASWVSVGNSEHEFRLWRADTADAPSNFTETSNGPRWSAWYVDAEIIGLRWVFRPVADIDDQDAADDLAGKLTDLSEITKIWVGASDGSEEFESDPSDWS